MFGCQSRILQFVIRLLFFCGLFLGVWIQMPRVKSEWLHGYMTWDLRLFAHSSSLYRKDKLHKEVVDYSTDRPLTHLRLTINLI